MKNNLVRRKNVNKKPKQFNPIDWDSSLPYGGKVVLAKKKLPESRFITLFQTLHLHINNFYAQLGYPHSQHVVGQKYLLGHGVKMNRTLAFEWLRRAADQGHPHAAYNLAIGHLEGLHEHIEEKEAHDLIKYAAENGVPEAKKVLEHLCSQGLCETSNELKD